MLFHLILVIVDVFIVQGRILDLAEPDNHIEQQILGQPGRAHRQSDIIEYFRIHFKISNVNIEKERSQHNASLGNDHDRPILLYIVKTAQIKSD